MVELTETLKREIGQHFVFGFHGHEVSSDIETLIKDYHLGHVILMRRNVQTAEQTHDLVQKLQQMAKDAGHKKPLMIGIDQENGLVSAFSHPTTTFGAAGTQFPGAMAIAATGSTELTERVSAATGRELKLAGINWAYSPDADVNSDPRNPVIGVRSFGDDPHQVGEYVAAVSRGLTSAGVAPSAKHFPGHGDTHVDSHLALPVIQKTKAELDATELVPFRAVARSIASIMTGHMALPKLTGDDAPASLARAATYGLLREDMKYEGVIVTDCLEMEAVAAREGGVPHGAVDALRAGADVVMICHRFERHVGSVKTAWEAAAEGRLDLDELHRSSERVTKLKDQFAGTWEQVLGTPFDKEAWATVKAESAKLSHQAYTSSIVILQNPNSIPLSTAGKVVVFSPKAESLNLAVDDAEGVLRTADGKIRNTAGPSYVAWVKALEQQVGDVSHVVYAPEETLGDDELGILDGATSVIFATKNADRSTWQLEYLRQVLATRRDLKKDGGLAVLTSCAPYDFLAVPSGDELSGLPVVASFEFTAEAMIAATKVIFGQEQASGRVPVHIGKMPQ